MSRSGDDTGGEAASSGTLEWKATDDPRWALNLLLLLALTAVVCVPQVLVAYGPWWTLLPLPVAAAIRLVALARARLRLTAEGIEVRSLRTRLYRWADIASVERAPEWESRSLVWVRLRGSVATSAPEVVSVPGVRSRPALDRALDQVVTVARRRAGLGDRRPT